MDNQDSPESAAGFAARGEAYENAGDTRRAVRDYKKALELEPGNADYRKNYDLIREKARAEGRFRGRNIDALEGRAARICIKAGDAFLEQKDYDTAIREYTKAIDIDPDPHDLYHARRGNAYFQKEAWDEALADYREALRINPHNKAYQDEAAACEERLTAKGGR
jgi:tetratricopeptide (TPR) repeat protein